MIPLQITFRGIEASEALKDRIREKADKLLHFSPRITRCHVTVEAPHRHHQQGNHFRVHVDVTAPGGGGVAGRDPADAASHEDPYQAVAEAFDALRRQLVEGRRRRRDARLKGAPATGQPRPGPTSES
jgi:ribosomal subunit interface protein